MHQYFICSFNSAHRPVVHIPSEAYFQFICIKVLSDRGVTVLLATHQQNSFMK